ncbi:MAG: hypothetical protein AB7U82_35080 [Blastocatellales bacterium]
MTVAVKEILRQAEPLSADEQLTLAAMLIEQARKKTASLVERRKWLDVAGAAPYPLTGEDAQGWVTRTRQEGDDERERQWRREK